MLRQKTRLFCLIFMGIHAVAAEKPDAVPQDVPNIQEIIFALRQNEAKIKNIQGKFRLRTRNHPGIVKNIRKAIPKIRDAANSKLEKAEPRDSKTAILQDDIKTLEKADPAVASSHTFKWAAKGDKRWYHREYGVVAGIRRAEQIGYDGRKSTWYQIGPNQATIWNGWINVHWPLPDDCGFAVNAIVLSRFLSQNLERCSKVTVETIEGNQILVFDVLGIPKASDQAHVKEQVKMRFWLDPNKSMQPVKIHRGTIVHLPIGIKQVNFPHYVIEPIHFLKTKDGAWFADKVKLTQLNASPWSAFGLKRGQVLTQTELESIELRINQGIPDMFFQPTLVDGCWVTEMATKKSYQIRQPLNEPPSTP